MNIKKSLLWDVTYQCNLDCLHCYNSENIAEDPNNILNDKSVEEVIWRIRSLDIDHIHLLGGEPLLQKKIYDIVNEAHKHNILISLNTNGTLLSKRIFPYLSNNTISQITISLDGATRDENDQIRGKGVYDKTIRKIKELTKFVEENKLNTIVQVASVITQKNIANIHKLPTLLNTIGIKNLDILKLYDCGGGQKNEDLLMVSSEEYFNSIKKIVIESYRNRIYTQIDCRPMVLQIINKNLGFNVKLNSAFNSCRGGEQIIFMNTLGDIYPCGPCSQTTDKAFNMSCNLFDSNIDIAINEFTEKIKAKLYESEIESICVGCSFSEVCSQCVICNTGSELCETAFKLAK